MPFNKTETMTPAEIALASLASDRHKEAVAKADADQANAIRAIARSHGIKSDQPIQLRGEPNGEWFIDYHSTDDHSGNGNGPVGYRPLAAPLAELAGETRSVGGTEAGAEPASRKAGANPDHSANYGPIRE